MYAVNYVFDQRVQDRDAFQQFALSWSCSAKHRVPIDNIRQHVAFLCHPHRQRHLRSRLAPSNAIGFQSVEEAHRGGAVDRVWRFRAIRSPACRSLVAGDPWVAVDGAERGGGLRGLHVGAAHRGERLSAELAGDACRQPAASELRARAQRPADPADRHSADRRMQQAPDRVARPAGGAAAVHRQRADRFRLRGAAVVPEPHHRHRAGGRHHRRRLYRGGGLAHADGAGRGANAGCGRGAAHRTPRPRAWPAAERDLRAAARRGRQHRFDGARHRPDVDGDAGRRVPGHSSGADADGGQPARHRIALRGDRRRSHDDAGVCDPRRAADAAVVAALFASGRTGRLVAAPRHRERASAR